MSEDHQMKAVAKADRSPSKNERSEEESLEKDRSRDRDRARRGERSSRFQPKSLSTDRDRDRGGRRAPAERRIYISNIPYEYRWQELKDLFRSEVGEVAYVELFNDDGEKPRGCGIIEFESAESVKKAVEKMHRYELKGRKLVVKEDFDVERDKYGRPMKGNSSSGGAGGGSGGGGGGSSSGMSGGNSRQRDLPRSNWQASPVSALPMISSSTPLQKKWGNTYGLSPQFLESLGINGPLVCRVFVANLDYKVDERKLKEVFRLAGKVTYAELNCDKDGKSRGHGVVEYEHPVEAVQAISMLHNQILYDRKMTVRMDRVNDNADGLPSKLPDGLHGIGMGLGSGGNPLLNVSRNLPNSPQGNTLGSVSGGSAGLGAGIMPYIVPPTLGLNNSGRFPDSPPLPRRSTGFDTAAGLAGNLPVGVGNLGSITGGGDIGGIGGGMGAGIAGGLGGGSGTYNSSIGGGSGGLGGGLGVGMGGGLGAGLAGGGGTYGSGGLSSGGGGSSFMGGAGSSHYGSSVGAGGGGGGYGGHDNYNSSIGGLAGAFPGAVERDYHGPIYADDPGRNLDRNNGSVRPLDTVIVKNLPQSTTWQMLQDQFRTIGEIKFAEIRNKDMGLIRFRSERDAQRAVKLMDRTRLEGHILDVSLF